MPLSLFVENKRSFFVFPLTVVGPNAVKDAAELLRKQRIEGPLDGLSWPDSVTNGLVNIREDEMDSRINKGN